MMLAQEAGPLGLVDPNQTLAELVVERPARAGLFERLRLDYCCGGGQTLAEACAGAGLDLSTVSAALAAVDALNASGEESRDWHGVGTEELCDHIVGVHHGYLRRAFPRLDELTATVQRVHGHGDPDLEGVRAVFERIRSALEPHLGTEESELFPAIVAADRGGPPVSEVALSEHEREHAVVGAALVQLRALCHDYDRARAHCNTHRALLDALEDLELDLHRHVHEENNILFRRARSALNPEVASAIVPEGASG